MSDEEFNRRHYAQMQRELTELKNSGAEYQAILDRFWAERREAEAEERRIKRDLDPYNLGLYDDDFHVPKTGKG